MLNYFSHIKNHLGHCNWPRWRIFALGGKQWASVKKTNLSLSFSIHFQSLSLFLNNSLLRHSSARIWLGNRFTQLTLKTAHAQRQFMDMVHNLVTSMGNVHLYIPVMKEPVWREVQQTPMMLYGEYHNCAARMKTSHLRIPSQFLRLWSWSHDDATSRYSWLWYSGNKPWIFISGNHWTVNS